ncbi:H/ACA ribonucleoprotein complex subunit 2 isoform X1 [Lagopus muta]|uniref:H/ACA ribonucleoprotein complex subunit 2 isoform X1 n=1 Tax=Lagopus muta TaxID=64668 RepID=UPI00209F358B|nr:H/ACA ribonucleoprotein complex subunit 2 isoform X1 [Lagopus muta]
MDLTSIKRGLAKGHIRSLAQFQCSLMLMFQNAIMYNAANHHVHRMALEMRREVLEQMQMLGEALLRSEHRSGQAQADPPGCEGGAEVHQQRRKGDHGAGRRHAAHRRVLPYPHHVRRQESALRLRPLQVVLNWDLDAYRKEALTKDLGAAAGSKRPTCVILLKPHEEYQEAYDECLGEVESLPLPL